MMLIHGEIQDGILFFERTFQVVLALAIGESFRQFIPEGRGVANGPPVRVDNIPALLSFMMLSVTFYLGMDRYFYRSYLTRHLVEGHYELALVLDSVLFMAESALFFAMARNLESNRWKTFYKSVLALLAVDIAWCLHGTYVGPEAFWGWIVWDIIFAFAILGMLRLVKNDRLASWIGVIVTGFVTFTSYSLFWNLYFG